MKVTMGIVLVLCVILFGTVSPSAIPMWEYLTQDEKIMYLYNMFQSQVQDFCETNACKRELKNYGWNKLKNMPEDHLDKMDPFQRDSNNIIWESVMKGHETTKTAQESTPTSTSTPENSIENEDNSDFSTNVETANRVPPPKDFTINYPQYTVVVGKPDYKITKQDYSSYNDNNYTSQNEIQDSTTAGGIPVIDSYGEYHRIPLTGPMVIKVHVDGTPVNDDKETLPEDEDLKQYKLTKTVFQNL